MPKPLLLLVVPIVLTGCLDSVQPDDYTWQQRQPIPGADQYDPPPAFCAAMRSTLEITDRDGQPASEFMQGELINVRVLVRNNSTSPITLTNPDGCPSVKFQVVNADNEVVASSNDGFACVQVLTPVEHAPGESTLHTWDWDQVMRNGEAAPLGDYTIYADERTECRFALSKSAPIRIR
ncbi:MAG: BsuPI-related putative proteinase inhibitor [Gammaproteobacteria bacterium]